MTRKQDWAEELARRIADDLGVSRSWPGWLSQMELVAARLRVVRQEGISLGVDQASGAILKPKEKPDAAP